MYDKIYIVIYNMEDWALMFLCVFFRREKKQKIHDIKNNIKEAIEVSFQFEAFISLWVGRINKI